MAFLKYLNQCSAQKAEVVSDSSVLFLSRELLNGSRAGTNTPALPPVVAAAECQRDTKTRGSTLSLFPVLESGCHFFFSFFFQI